MTYGKKFEEDLKKSLPSDAFVHRIKTRNSQYKGDNEIADFLVYRYPHLFIFEAKTTEEKRLPFDMLRPNQIIGIRESLQFKGVRGGFVVQFRDPYSHWFIPSTVIDEYLVKGAKSIPIRDCYERDDIIEIAFSQARKTCHLNMQELLDRLAQEE